MTEKRYKMVNTNLVDDDGLVYYLIKKDGRDVCQVFGKHTAKAIVTELNSLHEENQELIDALNQRTQQLDDCQQKVKETLQSFIEATKTMKQMKGANKLVLDSYIDLIKHIADELGVDFE